MDIGQLREFILKVDEFAIPENYEFIPKFKPAAPAAKVGLGPRLGFPVWSAGQISDSAGENSPDGPFHRGLILQCGYIAHCLAKKWCGIFSHWNH